MRNEGTAAMQEAELEVQQIKDNLQSAGLDPSKFCDTQEEADASVPLPPSQ